MGTREWILTAAVILVPLFIAIVVTLWSLKQVQYRRKTWKPPPVRIEPGNEVSARHAPSGDDTAAS